MHLDRKPAVRRRDERPAGDAERLLDEAALLLAPADVLDHRVREDDVELAVRERQLERVALDVADARVSLPKPRSFVQADGRDPLLPRVQLLEEVERPATTGAREPGSPKAKSSTPMSSTLVSAVGAIVSMKRANFRRRERSEMASVEAHLGGTVRCEAVIEDVVRPSGPYRLHLMTYGRPYETPLPGGGRGQAWQRADGHVAAARAGRGAARAPALLPRARRRHDRVQPPLPARPAARPVDPAPARPAAAADADGGPGAPPRGVRAADRSTARSVDRAGDRSRLRRARTDAAGDRRPLAGSAPPARPRDPPRLDARPRLPHDRSRAPARPSRSRPSRRGSSASAASGRGRSG